MQKSKNAPWIRHVFFTLVEHGAVRLLDAATTLVLIRAMSATHFGLFSVYQSWVGFLFMFLPSLELALYRNYGKLKSGGKLEHELSVYRTFNYMKLAVATIFVITLSLLPQPETWTAKAAILAFAMALPLSHALYGFIREPLRFEMKQHLVAFVSALQRMVLLGAILTAAHFFPGRAAPLCLAALAVYAVFGLVWSYCSSLVLPRHKGVGLGEAFRRIPAILTTTVAWIHLNGVITQAIQTLDILALNSFKTDLREIALYGIALKAANFFQILPVALINSFGVYLGRVDKNDHDAENKLVWKYSLIFFALSAGLMVVGLYVAEPLLSFLAKGKVDAGSIGRTTAYFKYQLMGVLILCISYPLSTYLGARAPLKKMFLGVFTPWLVLSAGAYFWSAGRGPLFAAQANVAVYGFLLVLLCVFHARLRRSS